MVSDERLLQRVAVTTLVVAVIAFGALVAYYPWVVGVNFVLGATGGLASLTALFWLTEQLTHRGAERKTRGLVAAGALQMAKYGLIAVGIGLLFRAGWAHGPALAAGFTLPTAVLCLKGAGRRLNTAVGADGRGADPPEARQLPDSK